MWVFEARTDSSYLQFSFDTVVDDIDLRIYTVRSAETGGMKRLLDYICREYECETVRFVNVISQRLRERLQGFEEKTVHVPEDHPSGVAGQPYQVLDGTWHPSGGDA